MDKSVICLNYMTNHPIGLPYCDGEFCDEAGFILCVHEPHVGKRYCKACLSKYAYSANEPSEEPTIPDNVHPLKKKLN